MKKLAAAVALALAAMGTAPTATADQAVYNDFVHWVDWMAKKYDLGTVYVGYRALDSTTYAQAQGTQIWFNSYFIANPDVLWADMRSDVDTNYHNGAKCSPTQIIAAHESAHVLDNLTGHTARAELDYALASGLTGTVSGYSLNADGSVNLGEALASAMVAVECGYPTEAEGILYNMLTT